jgi:hypothetical protein
MTISIILTGLFLFAATGRIDVLTQNLIRITATIRRVDLSPSDYYSIGRRF